MDSLLSLSRIISITKRGIQHEFRLTQANYSYRIFSILVSAVLPTFTAPHATWKARRLQWMAREWLMKEIGQQASDTRMDHVMTHDNSRLWRHAHWHAHIFSPVQGNNTGSSPWRNKTYAYTQLRDQRDYYMPRESLLCRLWDQASRSTEIRGPHSGPQPLELEIKTHTYKANKCLEVQLIKQHLGAER